MPPHNLTYTALGAAMLWVVGLDSTRGSAMAADGVAISAFMATHFAAAAGAVTWAAMDGFQTRSPLVLGTCSGAVAGLVCITPGRARGPMAAMVMGLAEERFCYFSCSILKARWWYDDSLDAFGVHAVGGTLGALLTGVFATRAVWNLNHGQPVGLIEGKCE